MRIKILFGFLAILGLATTMFLPVSEPLPLASLSGPQASVFQNWIRVNLAAMQAPDATFQSIEKDLNTPVRLASLDGGQKFFNSVVCSTGCSAGCSVSCTNTCSTNPRCR
jgi:hypothetical protein